MTWGWTSRPPATRWISVVNIRSQSLRELTNSIFTFSICDWIFSICKRYVFFFFLSWDLSIFFREAQRARHQVTIDLRGAARCGQQLSQDRASCSGFCSVITASWSKDRWCNFFPPDRWQRGICSDGTPWTLSPSAFNIRYYPPLFITDQWRRLHLMFIAVYVFESLFHTKASGSDLWQEYRKPGQRVSDAHTCVFARLSAFLQVYVFMLQLQAPLNIPCEAKVLTATAQADPSVVELSTGDFKAWLTDVDLVPCSPSVPFSIYQLRDESWFTPLSLFHFLLVERSTIARCQPL